MIHFIDKVLENLRPYVPLMQSIVWPIFLAALVYTFKKQLSACIDAIKNRIESGSPFEAGPLKFGELSKATPKERIQKLNKEVAEVEADTEAPVKAGAKGLAINASDFMKRNIHASYFLAEELAMNKLSAELGINIQREVRAGQGDTLIFDGVALIGRKFIAIEVKYISLPNTLKLHSRRSLDRINTFFTSLADDNKLYFSLVLAIVIDGKSGITVEHVQRQIADIKPAYRFPINVMVYRMEDLEKEYDIK